MIFEKKVQKAVNIWLNVHRKNCFFLYTEIEKKKFTIWLLQVENVEKASKSIE